jgi:V8-like Glu-specific endopeptidase
VFLPKAFFALVIGIPLLATPSVHAQSVSSSPPSTSPQTPNYAEASPLDLKISNGYSDAHARAVMAGSAAPAPTFPDSSPGERGTGDQSPIKIPPSVIKLKDTAVPFDFGSAGLPFSTARADLDPTATNDQHPFRAAGKLFFNINGKTYLCSASLIKPGLVVTAAHCVANFGTNTYYSNWEFHAGYRSGTSPYGAATVARAYVLTAYLDGSDPCQQKGVVCRDDVAVLVLNPTAATGNPVYLGKRTGWFAYAWNGAGFTDQRITHITQLGYPGCLDKAERMQRNDAQGAVDSTYSNNTIIGSLMCGGSSGGPWLINFGVRPDLTGTSPGSAPTVNAVVGVTSWGSTNSAVKWMGASPFIAENIGKLIETACHDYPAACKTD